MVTTSSRSPQSGEISIYGSPSPGSGWEIPADWHAPIVQSAVLLARGRDNPAARAFSDYLRSAPAQAIVLQHGYDRVD